LSTTAARVTTAATVALVGLVFTGARAARTGYLPHASPFDVMLGQASTPFQYRLLVPKLVYFVVTLFPPLLSETRLCLDVAEWLFFVGAFAGVDRLAWVLSRGSPLAAPRVVLGLLAVPFAYLVLPPFRPFNNASDVASLFFVVACVLALVAGRRGLFAALFLVGTLNRETTIVVLVAWGLVAYRERALRRDGPWLAACGAGFVAVKAALALAYRDNPGDGLLQLRHDVGDHGLHVASNLSTLVTFPRGAWFAGLVLAPLALAFAFRSRMAHPLLVACLDVAPGVILLLFVVGNADELRMFADVMMLVLVALATATSGSAVSDAPGVLQR
jgi:hypothetical protein